MEAILETQDTPPRHSITLKALLKSINDYDLVLDVDRETRKRARKIILAASKRVIERSQAAYLKKLSAGEGTKIRLKSTAAYAEQLNRVIEPILLHINENEYARSIIEEFLPRVAEEARYATKLEPEMVAPILRLLDTAEILGLNFNTDLREAFKEIIEISLTPTKMDTSLILLELAQRRFEAGEYLTSYLFSREATRSIIEDLTGAYTKEFGPEDKPSPEWRFEDYLGYLMEVGLVPIEEGRAFLELFVGEPEHLNSRWKKRGEANRALTVVKKYLDLVNVEGSENDDWL